MRKVERLVYKFSELSDTAKKRARDWWRTCEAQDFDTECIYEDAAACASILGIDLRQRSVKLMGGGTRQEPQIYYSGFSSQGDGACFEGRYQYEKAAAKKIRAHAPQDTELHRIADALRALQAPAFYRLGADMRHRGHYYHSGCMGVEVWIGGAGDNFETTRDQDEELTQLMRDFADWIYKQLEAEYWYRMSDENVDENISINEYEFDESGKIA